VSEKGLWSPSALPRFDSLVNGCRSFALRGVPGVQEAGRLDWQVAKGVRLLVKTLDGTGAAMILFQIVDATQILS